MSENREEEIQDRNREKVGEVRRERRKRERKLKKGTERERQREGESSKKDNAMLTRFQLIKFSKRTREGTVDCL